MATALVRRGGSQRQDRGIYSGEDVSASSFSVTSFISVDFGIVREEDVTEGDEAHGHVTSISVLRSYRRLGLAKRLMVQSRAYDHSSGFGRSLMS